jgi:primosomal protein N'
MTVTVVGSSKKFIKKAVCRNCSSKLEYVEEDVFLRRYSCQGSNESDNAIKCPSCDNDVVVRG